MTIRTRAVRVHHVPAKVTSAEERAFLQDLQKYLESERPRFVLDCSKVQELDNATINLLLACLEEVMKRNGDVRLASVNSDVEAALRFMGANRLFEIYPTTDGAIQSFQRGSANNLPPAFEVEAISSAEAVNGDSEFAA